MITIYATPEQLDAVREIISREERLDEWVQIRDFLLEKPQLSAYSLIVRQHAIAQPIDWQNVQPPYLLPEEIAFNPEHLLGLVFARLGNYARSRELLLSNPLLSREIDLIQRLQQGIPTQAESLNSDFSPFEEYRFCHNAALLHHYAASEEDFDPDKARYFYREALNSAPNGEYFAFTAKQYAAFLQDMDEPEIAEHLLEDALKNAFSDEAATELKAALCQVWMKKLVAPYDPLLLDRLKEVLWETLKAYQKQNRPVEEALTLIDASHVANISESFSEALQYISRAVELLRQEEMDELLANAHFRRGSLLYTWAQKGNPQFYKGAMESFQEALKVFTREDAPGTFAEIHHYLGVIYSEIPDEVRKKSIWAAVSSSSFQEALQFYNKEQYPYEYAMICNHYGNAISKYPIAIHSDNLEKAIFYYNEALCIRTAEHYPFERALTLLNYLEGLWYLNLGDKNGAGKALYQQMLTFAEEARTLTREPAIIAEAENHLKKLEELGQVLAREAHL
jgi:tetratricopeptide (TPR) repeat protein